jgi:hypothetical protein
MLALASAAQQAPASELEATDEPEPAEGEKEGGDRCAGRTRRSTSREVRHPFQAVLSRGASGCDLDGHPVRENPHAGRFELRDEFLPLR